MLFLILVVGFSLATDYLYTKNTFEQDALRLQGQTEHNIEGGIRQADTSLNYFDDSLNAQMKNGFALFLAEYERSDRDPSRMNLVSVQKNLGDHYTLYIINASGVIEYTTYSPELGLDFRTVPYLFEYLTRVRQSEGFFPDRIVRDNLGQGEYRKFAYMPTPDHKYILELGYSGGPVAGGRQALGLRDFLLNLTSDNPYVEDIHIYDILGKTYDEPGYLPGSVSRERLEQVISARTSLEFQEPNESRIVRYLFIDLKDPKYGTDPSRVIEITYSTRSIREALSGIIIIHILMAIGTIAVGCILAVVLSRRMIRPIHAIARDVDLIAQGNLDHRIAPTRSSEFVILEKSINRMVDSLKNAVREVHDGELVQQGMIDQLPVAVFFKRTSDGRYIFWNKACEEILGLPARDVVGKTDREIYPPDIAETIEREDREIILHREKIRNKIQSKTLGPGKIIHMITVPILDSAGDVKYLLGITEDVTQANINIKMDLLLSITRYDTLEQLSVIMNSLERAQVISSHEEVQQFFDKTALSVEAIKNQIAFMKSLQELGILMPRWQPVGQAFENAAKILPSRTVDITSSAEGIEIFADPLLPQVFVNLIENSLKFGGPKLAFITLSARVSDDSLVLVFGDNGNGIPKEDKEAIFDFESGKSTNFALPVAREILGLTDITIVENGVPGKGIRFEIRVPKGRFRFTRKPGEA